MAITYKDAGVDIDAGNEAVQKMKGYVKDTYRKEVLTDLGSFAGLFALDTNKYKEPVLLSGTDGVGTKLKVAFTLDKHDTIGIDAVAMCVNDILVQGAEPLFFLDYIAVGKLDSDKVAQIVKGVAAGCKESGCSLIGGETAEMPGFYSGDDYDIAGFAVGVCDKSKIITGEKVAKGDVLVGLPSSGLHSNGFSLARKVLLSGEFGYTADTFLPELNMTVAEAMLIPTRLYVKTVLPLLDKFDIHGMVHITGGGLIENLPRVYNEKLAAEIQMDSWETPAIFQIIEKAANIDTLEMHRVFNMGIGYVIIVPEEQAAALVNEVPDAKIIGKMVDRETEGVVLK